MRSPQVAQIQETPALVVGISSFQYRFIPLQFPFVFGSLTKIPEEASQLWMDGCDGKSMDKCINSLTLIETSLKFNEK